MSVCAFVGDELSGLGFRLGGIECHNPAPEETTALFRSLRERVRLILLTAEAARNLPPDLLRLSQASEHPLILVIADVRGLVTPEDRVELIRRQLGIAE